jgi:hypothetical protein
MMDWWYALNDHSITVCKAVIACVGAAVLAWQALSARVTIFRRGRRWRDALLVLVAALSCASWLNFGRFHYGPFLHWYELYHYYLGAKYPELGYTRLYDCTIAAEDQYAHLGPQLERLRVRDLTTNELGGAGAALAHPERCTDHFTPERWQEFEADSDFFRNASSWQFWSGALVDHGYNATPVWSLTAGTLASAGPASRDLVGNLGLLDVTLLTAMWAFVGWAFGWRTLCAAMIFWGTEYPGRYWWTGGAFLRTDWLFLTVASVCLLKKQRPMGAGFALGWATLLRIFPAFIGLALVTQVVAAAVRARRLVIAPWLRRFVAGAALAAALLVPLATWRLHGQDSWGAFVRNSQKHLDTPVMNNMGLKSVLAYDADLRAFRTGDGRLADPWQRWKQAQRDTFAKRRPIFWILVAGALVLFGAALATEAPWVALAFGSGLVLIAAQLTSYYLVVLLLLALLDERLRWASAALALAAALSDLIPLWYLHEDDCYVLTSEVWLVLVIALAVGLLVESRRQRASDLVGPVEPVEPVGPAKPKRPTRARGRRA